MPRRELTVTIERVPPHNIEAEQSIIGGILLDNEVLPGVLEIFRGDECYRPITGTTNSSYYRTGIFDGHAISIAQEVAAATENLSNIYIYGNLISYAYTGLYCSNSATTSYDQIQT